MVSFAKTGLTKQYQDKGSFGNVGGHWRNQEREKMAKVTFTLFLLLGLWSLLETKAESNQVVSLVIQNKAEAPKTTPSACSVAPETQRKVTQVLQQAQDRETRAVQEVLGQRNEEEEETVAMGTFNSERLSPELNVWEAEQPDNLNTIAKLFQWSIVASTNRNTDMMANNLLPPEADESETDKANGEESLSLIQHVTRFFRKATKYANNYPRKTRSLNTKYAEECEQSLLYSVMDDLLHARNEEEKTTALEVLAELSHKMENAKDILALGGVERMLDWLNTPSSRVRYLSLYTLAVCAQNNGLVQAYLMQPKRLERLVRIAKKDQESEIRTTALLAVSSVVDNVQGMNMLKFVDGVENVLLDAVQNENDLRAIRRALNLASDLVALDASQWLEKLKRGRMFEFAEYYLEHHEDRDIRESAAQLLSMLEQ